MGNKEEKGEGNMIYIHFIISREEMLHISWLWLDFWSDPKPQCLQLQDCRLRYLCASPHTSVRFQSDVRPVCHHPHLAAISVFVPSLHPDLVISKPQGKSCTALNQPCGRAMLNIYACGVPGSIAIFFSEEFV